MILKDIIDLCQQTARNAHVVDDEPIDPRMWQDYIMLRRNQFIKNFINEKGTIEQNTLQYELLDTESYDSANDLGGISLGKLVIRTEPCPTMIEGRAGMAIYEITSPDIESRTIAAVSMDRLRWCGNGVTNRDAVFAAFYDGRFYLNSGTEMHKAIKKIRVVGVFADPTQVSTFNKLTDDYPCNDYMIRHIMTAILNEDFNFIRTTVIDPLNNANGQIIQDGQAKVRS